MIWKKAVVAMLFVVSHRGAFETALGEMKSFLGFAEALMWAGSTMSRPLPDVVVVTRAVHACVEADKVISITVISSTLNCF